MASIQLRADRVITACERMANEIKKSYVLSKEDELTEDEMEVAKPLFNALRMIRAIKNLSEYSIKPERVNEEWFKSTSDTTITITHNDFELIGEFL